MTFIYRVPTLLQRKNSRTFPRHLKRLFRGCSILHLHYWTYCTRRHPRPTHLTKYTVHKDAIARWIMYRNLLSLWVQTWPYACRLIWTTTKNSRTFREPILQFPGLSRANLILQDFPGAGNFRRINQGLSMTRGNPELWPWPWPDDLDIRIWSRCTCI